MDQVIERSTKVRPEGLRIPAIVAHYSPVRQRGPRARPLDPSPLENIFRTIMAPPKILKLTDRPFRFGRHTLIFVHIPKCGGTSLHRTLEEIEGLTYRHLRGSPRDTEGIEDFDGVGGHQNFGATPLHQQRDRLVYITVIRPPRERVLSFYRHVLEHPNHHLHRLIAEAGAKDPVAFVKTLVAAKNYEITNLQTKMLTGRGDIPVAAAIAQVEANFSIVGLLGEPATYLEPLQRLFPRSTVRTNLLNVSRTPEREAWNSPELDALIEETNGKDIALYAHFERKNAAASAALPD